MGLVRVEIWAWPAEAKAKLADVKQSAVFEQRILPGMSVLKLFEWICETHDPFREYIFDPSNTAFYSHVVVTLNGRVISQSDLLRRLLQDGDEIIIVPSAGGG